MKWKHLEVRPPVSVVSDSSNDSVFPAFAPLISDAFEHIKTLPPRTEIPAGVSLLLQGEVCDSVFLLLGGLVKLVTTNHLGREATLGLRASGWYSGATFALTKNPSVYSVVTLSKCSVIEVPAAQFSSLLMQSSKLMRHFTATICNELISQSSAQAEVMTSSAEERLSTFMRERALDESACKVLDTLPYLKQSELAKLLSITPEHLSRLLRTRMTTEGNNRRRA